MSTLDGCDGIPTFFVASGEKVVAWNAGKDKWIRGVIKSKRELDQQDDRFKWTVQEQVDDSSSRSFTIASV